MDANGTKARFLRSFEDPTLRVGKSADPARYGNQIGTIPDLKTSFPAAGRARKRLTDLEMFD
jgi:hypothetical protein